MACPVVSGLAALIREYYPKLTAMQVKEIIMASVVKVKHKVNERQGKTTISVPFSDLCITGGIVNAYQALELAAKEEDMKFLVSFWISLSLMLAGNLSYGQILHPVKWAYGAKRINSTEAVLFLKATIDDGWHIYSAYQEDGGPVKTSFTFLPSAAYVLSGDIIEPRPLTRYEQAFRMEVSYFENEVIFQQKIKLPDSPAFVPGNLKFMACNDRQCLAPETISFNIPVK